MSSGLGFESKRPIQTVIKAYQPFQTQTKGQIFEDNINSKELKLTKQEKIKLREFLLNKITNDFDKYYTNYEEIEPSPSPKSPITAPKSPKSTTTLSPTSPTSPSQHPARNLPSDVKSSVLQLAKKVEPKPAEPTEPRQPINTGRNSQESFSDLKDKFNKLFGNKTGGSLQSYDLVMENIRQQLDIN
jgi:hypothetical protein